MKNIRRIRKFLVLALLLTILIAAIVPSAFAQRGFDSFNVPRTIQLSLNQNIGTANAVNLTNSPIIVRYLDGICAVTVVASTNLATSGTISLTLQGSQDSTNWANINNYAIITGLTSQIYTNTFYGGTNLTVTNNYLLPGTYIYPNAANTGFVGPYLQSLQYTNQGSFTLSEGLQQIGFDIGTVPSYMRTILTVSAVGSTNWTVAASVTAIPTTVLY